LTREKIFYLMTLQ